MEMDNRPFVVTDADNTLWDTDAVYADAQVRLLREVERASRSETEHSLEFLREIDQNIAVLHPMYLRYPPELLVNAVAAVLTGMATREAVEKALAGWQSEAVESSRLAMHFLKSITTHIPKLRIGVRAGLEGLSGKGIHPVVLTEGDKDRCVRLLSHHGIDQHIRAVVEHRKTPEAFRWLQEEFGGPSTSFMVGDQSDRDIECAHVAGYITIYFPCRFTPSWTKFRAVSADYYIADFSECVSVIGKAAGAPA